MRYHASHTAEMAERREERRGERQGKGCTQREWRQRIYRKCKKQVKWVYSLNCSNKKVKDCLANLTKFHHTFAQNTDS